MNRRRLLVGAGSLGSSLLAGCLGGNGSSGSGTTTTDAGAETTTSASTTTGTTTRSTTSTQGSPTATGTDEPTTRSGTSPSSPGPPDSTTTNRTGTTRSPTRSPASSKSNRIVDRALTVGDRDCGNPTDEGTVAFGDGRVVVTGTITGSDSCTTAVLDEATYNGDADRLRVVVATESERAEGTTCAQCLTEIDYEGTIEFAAGVPETVTLVHRGATGERRVTTATV